MSGPAGRLPTPAKASGWIWRDLDDPTWMTRPGLPDLDGSTSTVGYVSDTGGVTLIAREYVALPGGGIKRVYSVEQADGSVTLSDHEAWLASRAARCSCGRICCGRGRTCGQPECIARLASV